MKGENLEKNWKELWNKSKGNIYQSYEWAKVKENCGLKPIFLTLGNEKKLNSGMLIFEKSKKFPFIGTKRFMFSEGSPLFLKQSGGLKILGEFNKKSQDSFYGLSYATVVKPSDDLFKKAKYKKVINNTVLINLDKEKEELWKNLEKKSARWGVKTAGKNNLEFTEIKEEKEANQFYKLYKKTTKQGNFPTEKKNFILHVLKLKIGKLFLVKLKGKVIAGGLILIDNHNNYSILNLTSCSEKGLKLQAMPFLYWNLILYCKSIGNSYLDLGGYDLGAKQGEKSYNINKFKNRFGGEIVEQAIYSNNNKYPSLRKLLRKSRFLRRKYNAKRK